MKNLLILFGYTLFLANLLPLLFPMFHLLYFVPFLVIALYRCPFNQALWWSFTCGLIVDLFATQTKLGVYALNYCLITFWISGYKTHFFEDRFSTLPVMVFIFSALSNALQGAIYLAIGMPFSLSWAWLTSELIIIPLQTALYGLLAYGGMLSLYQKVLKKLVSRRTMRRQ